MKTCPSCGHASENAKCFCRHCGAALPGAANVRDPASPTEIRQAAERACPSCGKTLPRAGAKFCRFCGASLLAEEASPQPEKPSLAFSYTQETESRFSQTFVIGVVAAFLALGYFAYLHYTQQRETERLLVKLRTQQAVPVSVKSPPPPSTRRNVAPVTSATPPEAAPTTATTPPNYTEGLVAAYALDGNYWDSSGQGNHGAAMGDLRVEHGVVDKAVFFDGRSHIVVPDSPSLGLSHFTLSAWIYPTEICGGNSILEKGQGNSYYLNINPEGKPVVGFYDGTHRDVASPHALAIGTWYYIAGTYDGTYLRLFINGTVQSTLALSSGPWQTSGPLFIGRKYKGSQNDYFAGLIDQIRIYNRALFPQEIQREYTLRKPYLQAPESPPAATPGSELAGRQKAALHVRAVEQEQRLIRRIEPIYPEAARQARLQELVILQATIDEQGNVSDVRLIRGHPLLAEAAVTAVRQWKYRPLISYGDPTQVIATVVVQFPR